MKKNNTLEELNEDPTIANKAELIWVICRFIDILRAQLLLILLKIVQVYVKGRTWLPEGTLVLFHKNQ